MVFFGEESRIADREKTGGARGAGGEGGGAAAAGKAFVPADALRADGRTCRRMEGTSRREWGREDWKQRRWRRRVEKVSVQCARGGGTLMGGRWKQIPLRRRITRGGGGRKKLAISGNRPGKGRGGPVPGADDRHPWFVVFWGTDLLKARRSGVRGSEGRPGRCLTTPPLAPLRVPLLGEEGSWIPSGEGGDEARGRTVGGDD